MGNKAGTFSPAPTPACPDAPLAANRIIPPLPHFPSHKPAPMLGNSLGGREMPPGRSSSGDPQSLLEQVAEGSPGALDRLLAAHRQELLDYVRLRLSRQLSARLDPS